jgi:hypothetical protein
VPSTRGGTDTPVAATTEGDPAATEGSVVVGVLTTGEGVGATLVTAGGEEDGGAIGGVAAIGAGAALGSFTGVGVKRLCVGGVTIGAETAG